MITTAQLPALPAIVDGVVWHRRESPLRHEFRHRVYEWLIDLDDIPHLPWYLRPLAAFDARDHMGGAARGTTHGIKSGVVQFLTRHDVHLGEPSKVVMLANGRVFGHVFNPLTVFWCFDSDDSLRCVVAEVHNTYGDRHAYLLTPDENGRADVDKQLYVSPFNDVSGHYAMRFVLSERNVGITVALLGSGSTVFDAAFTGVPIPATRRAIARFALRMPAMPQRVSGLIRLHGIRLWARRLPVIPRPRPTPQEGV